MGSHVPAGADAPGLHPRVLRHVCTLLRERGVDVDRALAMADTRWADLALREQPLPLAQARWIVLALEREAGWPTLALEAGARLPLSAHGPLGALVVASADLRQAMVALHRFLPARLGWGSIALDTTPGGMRWAVVPRVDLGSLRRFLLDSLAGATARAIHVVTGRRPDDAVLELPWAAPAGPCAYEVLAGRVRFGAAGLAWWLPNALLDRPCATADAARHAAAWQACEAEERGAATAQRLDVRITALLRDSGGGLCQLDAMADRLGMTPRTLMRRLAREGTGFQALVDDWRRDEAWRLLHDPDVPLAEVAARLGFRGASNLSRSVRRWFGDAPVALRRAALAPPAPHAVTTPSSRAGEREAVATLP